MITVPEIKYYYESSVYIGSSCVQTKIMRRIKGLASYCSTPVTVFLTAIKIIKSMILKFADF